LEKIMAFTRDSLATYEKQPQTPVELPKTVLVGDSPPAASTQAATDSAATESTASDTSSVEGVSADSAAPSDDGTSDATDNSSNPTADSDSDTSASDTGDGKPRARGTAQERIEELVTERNAYRKYGEHLLAQIQELKGGAKPAITTPVSEAPAAATTADSGDEPPTLEQYKFDPVAFSKAQTKWLKDQVAKGVQTALANERGQQDMATAQAKFREREAASRQLHPDFDIVTIKNPNYPKLDPKAANLVIRSEFGTEIAYELGKNAGLSARIEKMDADSQIAAIGRLEGTIAARPAATTPTAAVSKPNLAQKTVTKAPPPPTPVRGSSNPQKAISEMSMDEFVAHERAQKLAKREQNLKIRRAMR
jgi:hypothetical protein